MKYLSIALAVITVIVFTFAAAGCKVTNGISRVSEDRSDEIAEDTNLDLVDANTGFAFNIFNNLIEEDKGGNVFISPLSIMLALAMTYNGAVGETSLGMADAMEVEGMDLEELNRGFSDLMVSILSADSDVQISITNSIWQRQDLAAGKDFIDINEKYYNSEVNRIDFSDPKAVDTVNGWIEDATEGKIEKMLSEIPADAVMYLINAIYFKGGWTYPFNEEATFDEDFHLEDGSTVSVPMMHIQEDFEYTQGDGFKILRLPYGQEKLAMYILLPDEGESIDDILAGMDADDWKSYTSMAEEGTVTLSMPRYKMEYGVKTLNDALIEMGMGIAFTPAADFSNIADGIFISRVMHKAVIEVNEEGSEAAAATVVEMVESAMPPDEPMEFKVDRPFMFTISDDRTGSILFMGKVMDPHA